MKRFLGLVLVFLVICFSCNVSAEACGPLRGLLRRVVSMRPGVLIPKRSVHAQYRQAPAGCPCGVECPCDATGGGVFKKASYRSSADAPTVTVVTMQGCRPCSDLKKAFASAPELQAFKAKLVDRVDARDLVQKLGIRSYPTLVILRPDGTALWRKTGYDGNPRRLADEMTAAINSRRRR